LEKDNYNNNYNEVIHNNELKENIKDNNEVSYTNLPTDKFNDINFKSVFEKKYTMEQLVDSMSNEELAFLSYGKSAKIRAGTGIIGGFYTL